MALLSIVIGIVFVMLLFSLLATSVMEILAGFLALRGKHLREAVGLMIDDVLVAFTNHPFYRQLSISSSLNASSTQWPSYISSGTFSAILMDVLELNSAEAIEAKIESLPDGQLRKLLEFLYREAGGDVLAFRRKVEEWFNEVMDRASGAYKRKTRQWLMGVGAAIALIFNVDPMTVYTNLSLNASLRENIADLATAYVQNNPAPSATIEPVAYQEGKAKVAALLNDHIDAISSPLGLGWSDVDWSMVDGKWWLYHIIGWITTAIAISLGATFWFDLLKMLVNIRGTGTPPAPTAASGLTTAPQSAANAPSSLGSGGSSFLTKDGANAPTERGAKKPPASRGAKQPPASRGAKKPPE
jgi:hypothetical protein